MPTYTNQCPMCALRDEYVRSMEERDTPPVCRKCGAKTVRAITFSGTVWAPSSGGHR